MQWAACISVVISSLGLQLGFHLFGTGTGGLVDAGYRKVPKFSDTRKLCCKKPIIQETRPNLWVFGQKDTNGIANSGDPDQTAPLGAV